MPNRTAFTGATLLALVAISGGLASFYDIAIKVGDYDVPMIAGYVAAGVFGLIAVMLMRSAHA